MCLPNIDFALDILDMVIHTANGSVAPHHLGRTLMHEHLTTAKAGWQSDPHLVGPKRADMIAECVDRIEELKSAGFTSLIDPCPIDLGRDAALSAEVAARTGFNIVVATGFFGSQLGAPYWRSRQSLQADFVQRTADIFIGELTAGIDDTGIKAGVIKIATETSVMTAYEKAVLTAAAIASNATGAPITTHTDAVLGDQQVDLLKGFGVPAHRIIVGHSCCSRDHAYHLQIVERGAYIGFDRFGYSMILPDEVRVASLAAVLAKGHIQRVVVSTDSVWCSRGTPEISRMNSSMNFTRIIVPLLKRAGISDAEIDVMVVDNPRRYFSDVMPQTVACSHHAAAPKL
jgi:phosphotriesterase-related protein